MNLNIPVMYLSKRLVFSNNIQHKSGVLFIFVNIYGTDVLPATNDVIL